MSAFERIALIGVVLVSGTSFAEGPSPTEPAAPDATPPAGGRPDWCRPGWSCKPEPTPTTPTPTPSPSAAPTTPPDENLLDNIRREEDAKPPDESETFGHQLKIFGVETTWSGYGDSQFSIEPAEREATFDAFQFNPIFSARITDTFSAEMELELEHGGAETELEYAMVDWTPLASRELVIRAGKFQIPLGKFNEQFHPSFRWPQITRPLMFEEVLPVGLSDIGLQVRGVLGRGTELEYQAWVVNGFAEHETEAAAEEEEEEGGFVRGLRDNFIDNNFDKTVGARVGVNVTRGTVTGNIAISGQSGKIDDHGAERLSVFDIDAAVAVGPFALHVEAAQSLFGVKHHYLDRFERGIYAQLAYTVGRWTLVGRWDYARQLEVDEMESVSRQLAAFSVRYAPTPHWSVRLELAVPFRPSGETDHTSIGAMIAFVF